MPEILFSPVAGVVVDKFDKRMIMIVSDIVAVIITIITCGLVHLNMLQVWHIYCASMYLITLLYNMVNTTSGAILSVVSAFQSPAFRASLTVLVPKRHFARASGLLVSICARAHRAWGIY